MQTPTADEKKHRARNLSLNLSREISPLWSNEVAMTKIRRFAPDRLEDFWRSRDVLDNRLRDYLDECLPWSQTQDVPGEITFPGARSLNLATGEWESLRCRTIECQDGPDVMSAARTVFLLVFELKQDFSKYGGSRV